MKRIAVLDANKQLIGAVDVADDAPGIDPGDLPLDGRYKWDAEAETFHPLGFGFGKVLNATPPYSLEYVVARMIEALGKSDPDAVPGPASEWLEWYNSDLRQREEERSRLGLTKR